MTDNIIVPVVSNPFYGFDTELEGVVVSFSIHWNYFAKKWVADISSDEIALDIEDLFLVGGIDLFSSYAIRELGQLFLVDLEGLDEDPTFEGLGDRFILLYVSKDNAPLFP